MKTILSAITKVNHIWKACIHHNESLKNDSEWAFFTAMNGSDAESAKRHVKTKISSSKMRGNDKILQDIRKKVEFLSHYYIEEPLRRYLSLGILFETETKTAMKTAY